MQSCKGFGIKLLKVTRSLYIQLSVAKSMFLISGITLKVLLCISTNMTTAAFLNKPCERSHILFSPGNLCGSLSAGQVQFCLTESQTRPVRYHNNENRKKEKNTQTPDELGH